MWRHAAAGLVLGAAWGVAARAWMRLISTDPEFSWSGTLLILMFAAAGGLGMGLISGARASGRRAWWRLSALLALPIVASPQGIIAFLPSFLLGGLGLSGRVHRWLQAPLLAVMCTMPFVMWLALMSPTDRAGVSFLRFVVGLVLLSLGMAYGGSQLIRRWRDVQMPRPRTPRLQMVAACAAGVGHAAGAVPRM